MKTFWIKKAAKIILMILVIGSLISFAVMILWNCLMPAIFGSALINFWQALGIVVLSKLLFGFGRGGWAAHHRHEWKEKWGDRLKNMTPEERDRFREQWKQRCGKWKHQEKNPESSSTAGNEVG